MRGGAGLQGGSGTLWKCGANLLTATDCSVCGSIVQTCGSTHLHTDKRGYRPKTDLSCVLYGSTKLSINQSIVYYVLQILRNCGSVYRSAGLYIRTCGAVYRSILQSYPTDFADLCGCTWGLFELKFKKTIRMKWKCCEISKQKYMAVTH